MDQRKDRHREDFTSKQDPSDFMSFIVSPAPWAFGDKIVTEEVVETVIKKYTVINAHYNYHLKSEDSDSGSESISLSHEE